MRLWRLTGGGPPADAVARGAPRCRGGASRGAAAGAGAASGSVAKPGASASGAGAGARRGLRGRVGRP